MTRRRIIILSISVIAILVFYLLSTFISNRHLEKIAQETDQLETQEDQEAEAQAQAIIEQKLISGDVNSEDLKIVFLTFDDGPTENTEEVLDILKSNDVPATFFISGVEDESLDSSVLRIVEEGNTLGNHTWSHYYNDYYTDDFIDDIQKLDNYQKTILGLTPTRVFRFPGGSLDATQEMIDEVTDLGYNYFDWNAAYDEENGYYSSEEAYQNLLDQIHSQSVSVVLFHAEDPDNSTELAILDPLIKQLKEEGYTFLPLKAEYNLTRFTQPTGSDLPVIEEPYTE